MCVGNIVHERQHSDQLTKVTYACHIGELLLQQKEIEKEPQDWGQGQIFQGPQTISFSRIQRMLPCQGVMTSLSGGWLDLKYLAFMGVDTGCSHKKLRGYPWWTFLEHLLCISLIQLMSLPCKGAYEKFMHAVIPRNELLMKHPEMKPSPKALIWGNSSRLNPAGPTVGKKPEKQHSENGGQRKERTWSQMQYKVDAWFWHEPETEVLEVR